MVPLLDSVLRGRPVGAALVLEIGDNEPFLSRRMAGVPDPTERVTEHLLDGQQRLTAMWKALTDGYEDRTYFAVLTPDGADESLVKSYSRWTRNGRRYPLWADDGGCPVDVLRPVQPDIARDLRVPVLVLDVVAGDFGFSARNFRGRTRGTMIW